MLNKSLIAWSNLFEGLEQENANTVKNGKALITLYNKFTEQNLNISDNAKENFTNFQEGIEKSTKFKYPIKNMEEINDSEIYSGLQILYLLSHESSQKDEFIEKEQKLQTKFKIFLKKINEADFLKTSNSETSQPKQNESKSTTQDKKPLLAKYQELEQVKQDLAKSEQKLKDLQTSAKTHDVQHLKRVIQSTETLTFQTENDIEKLENQIKTVFQKQEDVNNSIAQVKTELDSLGSKNSEFQHQIEYTQKMQDLEDQFKQYKKNISLKEKVLMNSKDKNEKLQRIISQINSAKDELTTSILISSKFDNLDESINIDGVETGTVNDLMDTITQLELEIADMRENTLPVDQQREIIEKDNQILEKEIEELEEQRFELRDQKDKIKRAREDLRMVQKSMADNTEVIDNDIQETISMINQRNLEIERLTALSALISYRPDTKPMSYRFRERAYKL